MAIQIGAVLVQRYRADELLGRGGMGEVWRCRDLEQDRDVAVKAVRAELLDGTAARLFHSEVVAVARLNHSSIVPVYDLVRDDDGNALLVMEYRAGPSLATFIRTRPAWSFIRDVLLQVLEALACAHARGVLHLDIKPENVVIEMEGGSPFGPRKPSGDVRTPGRLDVSAATERPPPMPLGFNIPLRATLVDFGIARIRKPGQGVERWIEGNALVGTIEYMAPEQCSGSVERLGPWTDLYAVGVMAYELCAGQRPFPDAEPLHAVVMRMGVPAPALRPRTSDVPSAFIDLCASLLATEPRDRPFQAADVLDELREMSAHRAFAMPGPDGPMAVRSNASTAAVARKVLDTLVAASLPELSEVPITVLGPQSVSKGLTTSASRVELSDRAFTEEVAAPPAGAYGLFGLRDLPVLGRPHERRAMWSAVRAAVVERRPYTVLLEGPAGSGKSRLARDVMERAVELGLCFAMQTSWSFEGSGDEGLRGLLENLLDTRGAPDHQVRARIDFWLQRIDGEHAAFARELALLLRPPPDAQPDAGLPLRVALEAIALAATLRPVLLWLDDVSWSRGEARALLEGIRTSTPLLPVCVIATAREEEMPDASDFDDLVEEAPDTSPGGEVSPASRTPRNARVRVDSLDLEATRQLVRGLLDVEDELCDSLAARAEGNPLFVTQLVSQLVEADALERVEGRYRLAEGVDPTSVPVDLGAVWDRRVVQSGADRLSLAALSLVRKRVSLEVAFELGRLLACGPPDAALPTDLEGSIAAALSAGLLRVEGGAYVWAHGLLRDYLVSSLDEAIAPRMHTLAADALSLLIGREDVQEERARHLRRAFRREHEACEAMLDAGLWSFRRADAAPRRARFEALAAWASEAGYADIEARALAELGYLHAEIGEAKPALAALDRARGALAGGGDLEHEGRVAASWVALRQAQTARLQARAEEGVRMTEEAARLSREAGVVEVEILAVLQQGVDAARAGDEARARAILQQAAELARTAGDRVGESRALRTLAHIEAGAQALTLVERSLELARAAGALREELVTKGVWVHLLWQSGARDAARREARSLAAEAGRRQLRQTVSILELQSAGWANTERAWSLVREHRDAAARWGAASGAISERVTLLALDLLVKILDGDLEGAEAICAELEQIRNGYDDPALREILARCRELAPPALAHRIACKKPS